MKKGFTLIEFITVVIIFLLTIVVISGIVKTISAGDDFDFSYLNPQFESARQQRKIAEELKRQNDLMEERLNQENNNYENRNTAE